MTQTFESTNHHQFILDRVAAKATADHALPRQKVSREGTGRVFILEQYGLSDSRARTILIVGSEHTMESVFTCLIEHYTYAEETLPAADGEATLFDADARVLSRKHRENPFTFLHLYCLRAQDPITDTIVGAFYNLDIGPDCPGKMSVASAIDVPPEVFTVYPLSKALQPKP